jgi:hypothetical protein
MRRLLAWLWPPYDFYLTKRAVDAKQTVQTPWAIAIAEMTDGLDSLEPDDLVEAEKLASSLLDAENRRKDVLEAKASTFVVTPAVATAITAAVAPLTKDLKLSASTAAITAIAYAIALVHFLVSAWYATAARRAAGFTVLSAANAHRLMTLPRKDRIAERLAYARLNEPALTMKANRLSLAEDLFLRGLAFLALASFLAVVAHVVGI